MSNRNRLQADIDKILSEYAADATKTVGELAKMTDMRLDRFKYRIQVGGIDYAMSKYKTHKQWRKAKEGTS